MNKPRISVRACASLLIPGVLILIAVIRFFTQMQTTLLGMADFYRITLLAFFWLCLIGVYGCLAFLFRPWQNDYRPWVRFYLNVLSFALFVGVGLYVVS